MIRSKESISIFSAASLTAVYFSEGDGCPGSQSFA